MRCLFIALAILGLAGCAETDPAPDDVTAQEPAPEPFLLDLHDAFSFDAAAGLPEGSGGFFFNADSGGRFEVPEGAMLLEMDVAWTCGNECAIDIVVQAPGGRAPSVEGEGNEARLVMEEPPPGMWSVEARPQGAVVDAQGSIAVHIEGLAMPDEVDPTVRERDPD